MNSHLSIWIIKTGEPLPFDKSARPLRAAALGYALAARGHSVNYWTSTFLHRSKTHLDRSRLPPRLEGGVALKWLNGPPYRRNISIERILNHRHEAREFYRLARNETRPDIIVCSLPTLDLVVSVTKFGAEFNIPVVIDIRDMWPEVFVLASPKPFRWLVRFLIFPLFSSLRVAVSRASCVVGVSEGFVNYALSVGRRRRTPDDAVFHTSRGVSPLSIAQRTAAEGFWDVLSIGTPNEPKIACYAGSLTRRSCGELLRLVRLFSSDPSLRARWSLVICGTGDLEKELRDAAGDNVSLLGWVGPDEIEVLMERSDVGVIAYPNEIDFLSTCPNKVSDYLGAGLPILSFLDGEVGRMVRKGDCGWVYQTDADVLAALKEIEANPIEQRNRRERARKAFNQNFDANRVYSEYADHIESLARRTHQNPVTVP